PAEPPGGRPLRNDERRTTNDERGEARPRPGNGPGGGGGQPRTTLDANPRECPGTARRAPGGGGRGAARAVGRGLPDRAHAGDAPALRGRLSGGDRRRRAGGAGAGARGRLS